MGGADNVGDASFGGWRFPEMGEMDDEHLTLGLDLPRFSVGDREEGRCDEGRPPVRCPKQRKGPKICPKLDRHTTLCPSRLLRGKTSARYPKGRDKKCHGSACQGSAEPEYAGVPWLSPTGKGLPARTHIQLRSFLFSTLQRTTYNDVRCTYFTLSEVRWVSVCEDGEKKRERETQSIEYLHINPSQTYGTGTPRGQFQRSNTNTWVWSRGPELGQMLCLHSTTDTRTYRRPCGRLIGQVPLRALRWPVLFPLLSALRCAPSCSQDATAIPTPRGLSFDVQDAMPNFSTRYELSMNIHDYGLDTVSMASKVHIVLVGNLILSVNLLCRRLSWFQLLAAAKTYNLTSLRPAYQLRSITWEARSGFVSIPVGGEQLIRRLRCVLEMWVCTIDRGTEVKFLSEVTFRRVERRGQTNKYWDQNSELIQGTPRKQGRIKTEGRGRRKSKLLAPVPMTTTHVQSPTGRKYNYNDVVYMHISNVTKYLAHAGACVDDDDDESRDICPPLGVQLNVLDSPANQKWSEPFGLIGMHQWSARSFQFTPQIGPVQREDPKARQTCSVALLLEWVSLVAPPNPPGEDRYQSMAIRPVSDLLVVAADGIGHN
ncbi:hypothetical protein ACRALDRAFT_210565 [Sodiomyces alcalophilus JCM 7366]|uniref:uncharacterized protein n=1 Tax=Sodiomyces alcalophilus JCM 7366 TaxID=591952 RepID=UPI0039B6939D